MIKKNVISVIERRQMLHKCIIKSNCDTISTGPNQITSLYVVPGMGPVPNENEPLDWTRTVRAQSDRVSLSQNTCDICEKLLANDLRRIKI